MKRKISGVVGGLGQLESCAQTTERWQGAAAVENNANSFNKHLSQNDNMTPDFHSKLWSQNNWKLLLKYQSENAHNSPVVETTPTDEEVKQLCALGLQWDIESAIKVAMN